MEPSRDVDPEPVTMAGYPVLVSKLDIGHFKGTKMIFWEKVMDLV